MQAIPAKLRPIKPPLPHPRRKLERTTSFESIMDKDYHEYAYIEPHVTRAPVLPRTRPPRPPPPRPPPPKRLPASIKNKHVITQAALTPSAKPVFRNRSKSLSKSISLASTPSLSTSKEHSRNQKDKHN